MSDAMKFAELRYGMIVHYGLYSLLGRHEWTMNREQIAPTDYRKLAARFTASAFDANGWQAERMNAMVREIQPHILFNGRNGLAGDFATPEGHLGAPDPWRPWEACMTLNNSWGYCEADTEWKTPHQVIDLFECDETPEVYLTGGMRVPKVPHPHYDPCPSDISH